LLAEWPRGGPPLEWKKDGIGGGYSSPILVGETIYITGDGAEDLVIYALDLRGQERWRARNGARWRKPWPGARSACTYDDNRIYHMNAHGRLACLDAATSDEIWAVDVLQRFGARNVIWGRSESVVVRGEKVFVTTAGSKGLMAALHKKTGRTIWTTPPLKDEKPTYASPLLVTLNDKSVLVCTGSQHSFGVNPDDGRLLWKHRHPVPENVLGSTPLLVKDSVLITNSSRDDSAVYRLQLGAGGDTVNRVWSRGAKNGQGGFVYVADRLFGGNGRGRGGEMAVVDPQTGAIATAAENLGFGASAYADGRIYYLSQEGEAALLKPTSDGAEVVGRFRLVQAKKKDAWAHPVICRGRLYLRYHDTLYCYDVRGKR